MDVQRIDGTRAIGLRVDLVHVVIFRTGIGTAVLTSWSGTDATYMVEDIQLRLVLQTVQYLVHRHGVFK